MYNPKHPFSQQCTFSTLSICILIIIIIIKQNYSHHQITIIKVIIIFSGLYHLQWNKHGRHPCHTCRLQVKHHYHLIQYHQHRQHWVDWTGSSCNCTRIKLCTIIKLCTAIGKWESQFSIHPHIFSICLHSFVIIIIIMSDDFISHTRHRKNCK